MYIDFLKICRAEYDNLLESSPGIDLDIISMFNNKFNDKYPDVRKPIICNGLKAIKPFNKEDEEERTEEPKSIVLKIEEEEIIPTNINNT